MARIKHVGLFHVRSRIDDTKVRRDMKSAEGRVDKREDVVNVNIFASRAASASLRKDSANSFAVSPHWLGVPHVGIVPLSASGVFVFIMLSQPFWHRFRFIERSHRIM